VPVWRDRAVLTPRLVFEASEELAIGNVKFTTYDLGGHQQGQWASEAVHTSRFLSLTFGSRASAKIVEGLLPRGGRGRLSSRLAGHGAFPRVQGPGARQIFVIVHCRSSSDFGSQAELDALLSIEELSKVPFLILGNKVGENMAPASEPTDLTHVLQIDAPGAVSEEELRHALGMYQTSGKVRRGHLCPNCGFRTRLKSRRSPVGFLGQGPSLGHASHRNFHVLGRHEAGLRRR
jgi:hypothetical protein